MARMVADCREFPSESGCTLTITGDEDEVVRAAAIHAADVQGHGWSRAAPADSVDAQARVRWRWPPPYLNQLDWAEEPCSTKGSSYGR